MTDLYPERRSPRLAGFDYQYPGAYFITAVTAHRACLFADARDATQLTNAGRMALGALRRVPQRFPGVTLDEHVVMPNHLHAILILSRDAQGSGTSIPLIVGNFKSFVVAEYRRGVEEFGWPRYGGSLWQRSYFDHVIRNDDALSDSREYIRNNPLKWALDQEHPRFHGRPLRAAPTNGS